MDVVYHDVIIVGAGLAGLRAAVELAGSADVAVLSKLHPFVLIPVLLREVYLLLSEMLKRITLTGMPTIRSRVRIILLISMPSR